MFGALSRVRWCPYGHGSSWPSTSVTFPGEDGPEAVFSHFSLLHRLSQKWLKPLLFHFWLAVLIGRSDSWHCPLLSPAPDRMAFQSCFTGREGDSGCTFTAASYWEGTYLWVGQIPIAKDNTCEWYSCEASAAHFTASGALKRTFVEHHGISYSLYFSTAWIHFHLIISLFHLGTGSLKL